jgi:hypothetical protein
MGSKITVLVTLPAKSLQFVCLFHILTREMVIEMAARSSSGSASGKGRRTVVLDDLEKLQQVTTIPYIVDGREHSTEQSNDCCW